MNNNVYVFPRYHQNQQGNLPLTNNVYNGSSTSNGGGGGMDAWQESVEIRLGQIHNDISGLKDNQNKLFLKACGFSIACFILMGSIFAWGFDNISSEIDKTNHRIDKLDTRMDSVERKLDLLLYHFKIEQPK